jgi:serine/threonine-protein kinase
MTDRLEHATHVLPDITQVSGSGVEVVSLRSPSVELEAPVADPLRSGTSLPARIRDEGEIAQGGMGMVRKVFDTLLLRQIAMKTMAPDFINQAEARERFIQEAQITGQLEHPNIVPLYDTGQIDGIGDYFTLKLVRGRTLAEELTVLRECKTSEEDLLRVVQMMLKVCDAIGFAHSRGVVHRDLKPSNLMIGEYGQVYVVDWGVAVVADSKTGDPPSVSVSGECVAAGSPAGTPGYMAPEQALGASGNVDKRSDVYALGAILYQVLTGNAPHPSHDPTSGLLRVADRRIPFPESSKIWPRIPATLGKIAMKALEPNADDRYQTVLELRHDLDNFLAAGDWFETCTFATGELIVAEGAKGEAAYIIVSGRCEVRKQVGGNDELIRSLGAGDVFGETAIFAPQPRTASVVAVSEVSVKIVTRAALEFELRRSPWFGSFVRALAARFSELDRRLSESARAR